MCCCLLVLTFFGGSNFFYVDKIQIKRNYCRERYLPTGLFFVVYKVVLTFDSADKMVLCDMQSSNDANEQCCHVVSFIML